jgi:hypothetical protein
VRVNHTTYHNFNALHVAFSARMCEVGPIAPWYRPHTSIEKEVHALAPLLRAHRPLMRRMRTEVGPPRLRVRPALGSSCPRMRVRRRVCPRGARAGTRSRLEPLAPLFRAREQRRYLRLSKNRSSGGASEGPDNPASDPRHRGHGMSPSVPKHRLSLEGDSRYGRNVT